jgi:hypothetical protein
MACRCPRRCSCINAARNFGHEPKPYCTGVGCSKDTHKHPATFMGGNLAAIHQRWGVPLEPEQRTAVHVLHARPEQDFPIGSEWHYGPIYENMETRVRVLKAPKQSAGSKPLRDYSLGFRRPTPIKVNPRGFTYIDGPRSWFVECEVISSPFHPPGHTISLPPCALIPAAAVDAERGIASNCSCCSTCLCQRRCCRCENWPTPCYLCAAGRSEPAHVTITRLTQERDEACNAAEDLRRALATVERDRDALRRKLDAAREALRR